ncbi:hypothetical protein EPO04_03645 [Patescibacteria group bacterium]|nr:MAG: hypothetical protein EPO04_03645 [Patescibacteria group bacterium]
MKARYFFIASAVALVVAVNFLIQYQRSINATARQVKADDVAAAPTDTSMLALQKRVESHMGTSVAIVLEGSYQRAVDAAQAAASPQANASVYAQAQAACAKSGDSIKQSKCVTNYVNSHSAPAANPQPMVMPDKAAYTKSFHGSSWTMDGTGIALLVAMLCAGWGLFLLAQPKRHTHPQRYEHQVYRGPNPRL